jgi:hypothetical protein
MERMLFEAEALRFDIDQLNARSDKTRRVLRKRSAQCLTSAEKPRQPSPGEAILPNSTKLRESGKLTQKKGAP